MRWEKTKEQGLVPCKARALLFRRGGDKEVLLFNLVLHNLVYGFRQPGKSSQRTGLKDGSDPFLP